MWKPLSILMLMLMLLVANLGEGVDAAVPPRVMVMDVDSILDEEETNEQEEKMMHDHLRHHLTKKTEHDDGRSLLDFKGVDPSYDLGRCQGDCDNDHHCAGDLVCYQRGMNQGADVPGCTGADNSRTDYCVDLCDWKPNSPNCGHKDDGALDDPPDEDPDPPASYPSRKTDVRKVANDLSSGQKLGLCESDCDGTCTYCTIQGVVEKVLGVLSCVFFAPNR